MHRFLMLLRDRLTPDRLCFFFATFFLVQLALFLVIEGVPGVLDRRGEVRGRDFLQFYIAGRLIALGEADRLYDQMYFRQQEKALLGCEDGDIPYLYFSIYPPTVALLVSPLGRLPYGDALLIWWLLQVVCFLVSGVVLFRVLNPPPGWRWAAWLGLWAFSPVIITFWTGQLAALLLLILLGGFELHRSQRPVLAGCVLSLLAMKPQLAVGVVVWLLLRRDGRALGGFCLGLLLQAGLVSIVLSPGVLVAFVQNMQLYSLLARMQQFTPDHQHGVAGILIDLFGPDYSAWARLAQLLVAGCAGVLLFRVIRAGGNRRQGLEMSAAVLFTLLATPHLLSYDLSYLLIPIAYLLSREEAAGTPKAVAPVALLYLGATLAPLYLFVGFSLLPLILLGVLAWLAYHATRERGGTWLSVPSQGGEGIARPAEAADQAELIASQGQEDQRVRL